MGNWLEYAYSLARARDASHQTPRSGLSGWPTKPRRERIFLYLRRRSSVPAHNDARFPARLHARTHAAVSSHLARSLFALLANP